MKNMVLCSLVSHWRLEQGINLCVTAIFMYAKIQVIAGREYSVVSDYASFILLRTSSTVESTLHWPIFHSSILHVSCALVYIFYDDNV